MRWTIAPLVVTTLLLASTGSFASKLTYLSCDLPGRENAPDSASHFDFALDEQNSTVSFFVKEANATNKEEAVFGPEAITWTNNLSLGSSITRTISRVDLGFLQDMVIAGIASHEVGRCLLIKRPSNNKF
jgi:hypothetical protein